jgi:hypothetical protein
MNESLLDEAPALVKHVLVRRTWREAKSRPDHEVTTAISEAFHHEAVALTKHATRLVSTRAACPHVVVNISDAVFQNRRVPEAAVHAGVNATPEGSGSGPVDGLLRKGEAIAVLARTSAREVNVAGRVPPLQRNNASKRAAVEKSICSDA